MSGISTHILDVARGRPAAGVPVVLERADGQHWVSVGAAVTDADGRCAEMLAAERVGAGRYRITFEVAVYFARWKEASFYPEISVVFTVQEGERRYHVPLLLSAFGYSTYRGS